jgi:hypothetical protein
VVVMTDRPTIKEWTASMIDDVMKAPVSAPPSDGVNLVEIVTRCGSPIGLCNGLPVRDNPVDAVADAAIFGVGYYQTKL